MGKTARLAIAIIFSLAIIVAAIFSNPKLATIVTDFLMRGISVGLWFIPGALIIFPYILKLMVHAALIFAEAMAILAILGRLGLRKTAIQQ